MSPGNTTIKELSHTQSQRERAVKRLRETNIRGNTNRSLAKWLTHFQTDVWFPIVCPQDGVQWYRMVSMKIKCAAKAGKGITKVHFKWLPVQFSNFRWGPQGEFATLKVVRKISLKNIGRGGGGEALLMSLERRQCFTLFWAKIGPDRNFADLGRATSQSELFSGLA